MPLLAHQRHRAVESLFAQGDGDAGAGFPGADDDDLARGHRALNLRAT